jgi:hypothetical protein
MTQCYSCGAQPTPPHDGLSEAKPNVSSLHPGGGLGIGRVRLMPLCCHKADPHEGVFHGVANEETTEVEASLLPDA